MRNDNGKIIDIHCYMHNILYVRILIWSGSLGCHDLGGLKFTQIIYGINKRKKPELDQYLTYSTIEWFVLPPKNLIRKFKCEQLAEL
ncbi:hypothetical protein SAMN05216326_1184 [Nitrosomonas marina]|uniref:Uncharacterized protein n=1 Tax=Nitrosomonas marina TaxID=917 RepID=A0A1I0D2R7_9PROT|nr:hypothetical protein SAMN05216326_1184 [Nitrosomonas marina]